jgi:hypothetical protein
MPSIPQPGKTLSIQTEGPIWTRIESMSLVQKWVSAECRPYCIDFAVVD